ncbi:MAG: hypothetical protein SNJ77_00800 [Cytophagales bacterium]
MSSFPFQRLGYFVIMLMMQLLIFRDNALFGVAFGFVYVSCILMWPIDTNRSVLMTFAFFVGLIIDIFSDTLGMHIFTCVLTAFLRSFWIQSLTPTGGYDKNTDISLNSMGLSWFLSYVSICVFVHVFVLHLVESMSLKNFGWTLLKIVCSTMLTVFVFYTIELFNQKRKNSY